MNELMRCKDCGKPISKDQEQNFFSLCYECFRRFKSSKMRKGYCMKCFGCISLVIVLSIIIMSVSIFEFIDPEITGMFIFISIIAVIFPFICIFSGVRQERKWNISLEEKPIIENQEITTATDTTTKPTHFKYCPECGNKIEDFNQKFCVNCGTEI